MKKLDLVKTDQEILKVLRSRIEMLEQLVIFKNDLIELLTAEIQSLKEKTQFAPVFQFSPRKPSP